MVANSTILHNVFIEKTESSFGYNNFLGAEYPSFVKRSESVFN